MTTRCRRTRSRLPALALVALLSTPAWSAPPTISIGAPGPNPVRVTGAAPTELVDTKDLGIPLDRSHAPCRRMEYIRAARAPLAVLRLAKDTSVGFQRVPVSGYGGPLRLVIAADDGRHLCLEDIDSMKSATLDAGTWRVFGVQVDQGYALAIHDLSRPQVVDTPRGTPVLVLGREFSPNPLVLEAVLGPADALVGENTVAPGLRCLPRSSPVGIRAEPSFVLDVREDHTRHPLSLSSNFGFVVFDATKAEWSCVLSDAQGGAALPLPVGKHLFFAIRAYPDGAGFDAATGNDAWLLVRDSSRRNKYLISPNQKNTTTVPSRLSGPLLVQGETDAPQSWRPGFAEEACRVRPETPTFYLRTQAPIEQAVLTVVGTSGALRVLGPLDEDGQLKVPASAPSATLRAAQLCLPAATERTAPVPRRLDGLYAVYVAGAQDSAQTRFYLQISEQTTVIEPLARAADPPSSLATRERSLQLWYPLISQALPSYPNRDSAYYDRVHQLWMDLPLGLISFAARDLRNGVKAGTPLALLQAGPDALALTPNGDQVTLSALSDLVARPAQLAMPAPITFDLADDELPRFLDDKPAQELAQRREQLNQCMDKVLAELDPDGQAGAYDLVTYRGGRVVRVEGLADRNQRAAAKRCNEAAYLKYLDAIANKTNAAQTQKSQTRTAAVRKRIEGLLSAP